MATGTGNSLGQSASIPPVIDHSGFEGPYKEVCAERPQNYSYYAKYDIEWGDLS
jgi:hypothetical protein